MNDYDKIDSTLRHWDYTDSNLLDDDDAYLYDMPDALDDTIALNNYEAELYALMDDDDKAY